MPLHDIACRATAIELRVCELIEQERTLTFTALATTLADCSWISLLRTLNHLKKQHVIRLIPTPWAYQICGTTGMTLAPRTD